MKYLLLLYFVSSSCLLTFAQDGNSKATYKRAEVLLYDSLNIQGAISEAKKLVLQAENRKDSLLISESERLIATAYIYNNILDSALVYLYKAQISCPDSANVSRGMTAYYMGVTMQRMGLLESAIGAFREAETFFVIGERVDYIPSIYNELGKAYATLENFEEAIVIFNMAEEIATDSSLIPILNLNLANCYFELGLEDKSEVYYNKVLKDSVLHEHDVNYILSEVGATKLLIIRKSYDFAVRELKRLLVKVEPFGDALITADLNLDLSKVYAHQKCQKKSDSCLMIAEELLILAENSEGLLHLEIAKSEIYEIQGLFEKALSSEKRAGGIREDLRTEKKQKLLLLTLLEFENSTGRSNKNAKIENGSNVFWIIVMVFTLSIILYLFLKRVSKKFKNNKKSIKPDAIEILIAKKIVHAIEVDKVYLKNDISVRKIASMLSTNTTYASKACNNVLGKSFNQLINEHRITHAIELMKLSKFKNYTIEAISMEVGFLSKSSFNRSFKNIKKCTPSEYRKKE